MKGILLLVSLWGYEGGFVLVLGFRKSIPLTLIAIAVVSSLVLAQTDTRSQRRLRSPASVRGFIGGESHDSYVIHASKGQIMTVEISWQKEGDNRAEFTITRSSNFFESEPVDFGKTSEDEKSWTGEIPSTGDYHIYVVAHPTAHYKLKVTAAWKKGSSGRPTTN